MVTAKKPHKFVYEGKDRFEKIVSGEIYSTSVSLAKAELRKQGIVPLRISRKAAKLFSFERKKINSRDLTIFVRQLSTMVGAGLPIVQSLDIIIRGQEKAKLKSLLFQLKTEIETGTTLADSFSKHPQYFDDLFCNLLEAGEQSGAVDAMLGRIANYREKTESLKRKIKKALFYPTAVLAVALIVSAVLLLFVVPQFKEIFKSFNADLPTFTLFVLNISQFLQNNWLLFIVFCVVFGVALKRGYHYSIRFRRLCDEYELRMPLFGSLFRKAVIARFARTLGTTFSAGVPLVEGLASVSGAAGNLVFRSALETIREKVQTGTPLNVAMQHSNLFPLMVVQMIAIGEESGSLDAMLNKVASIYEEEVDLAVDGLSSLLEPIVIVVLGIIIGGLVVAMYLPIFNLGSVI